MIKNYIKIAFRNLKKSPFLTTVNILGLVVGITGSLLVSLYILDEMGHNSMFSDADRIYRIETDIKFGGAEIKSAEASAPMAGAMKNDFAEVEEVVRFRNRGKFLIRRSDATENTQSSNATFVDPSFFNFFGLELLSGNEETALEKANTVVLTKSVAEIHFGKEDAVGKTVLLDNQDTYIVTGIIEDFPLDSFLRDHGILMAMDGLPASKENLWGSMNFFTYVKLREGADIDEFDKKVAGMLDSYMLPWAQKVFPGMTAESFAASGDYIEYHTIPLTDIYLHSDRKYEMSETSSIQNIYILASIGLFLIFLACINFMNLSTAYSLKRAKEVGIRKTLGSNKWELVRQFLIESGLVAAVSMLLAIVVSFVALPYFNNLAGKAITMPLNKPFFWFSILITTILLGFLSGSYPAFFMSRFKPIETLKGNGKTAAGGGFLRNALVIFQFSISVVLIVSTFVVFQQLEYIQNKDLGYSKEQVLLINNAFSAGDQLGAFKDEVEKLSTVESTTVSSSMPTPSSRSDSSFFPEGKFETGDAMQMQVWGIDYDYLKTLGLQLISGRDFDKNISADSNSVIINEANLKNLGLDAQNAIGTRFTEVNEEDNPVFYTIVGVVRNFHYSSMRENIGPVALFLRKSEGIMAVKLKTDDYSNSITQIENLWKQQAPGQPFDYSFMDEDFNDTYRADQRLAKVFIVFTFLSIFIACLGLFALASFNAQKRVKEIGVRKVLGASVSQITIGLTTDFLKLVAISTLIALPLGFYIMKIWLQDFSYRIDIGWEILAVSAILVILIAALTVSYQSIKAARANPMKSLKTE